MRGKIASDPTMVRLADKPKISIVDGFKHYEILAVLIQRTSTFKD